MKLYLSIDSSIERENSAIPNFEYLASIDRVKSHSLVATPEEADIILFVDAHQHFYDWNLSYIKKHSLYKKYPKKIFIYDERDRSFRTFPGIYVSMNKIFFEPNYQRAWCYHAMGNRSAPENFKDVVPDLLFSFIGNITHKFRKKILKLSHERSIVENANVSFFDFSSSRDESAIAAQKKKIQSNPL